MRVNSMFGLALVLRSLAPGAHGPTPSTRTTPASGRLRRRTSSTRHARSATDDAGHGCALLKPVAGWKVMSGKRRYVKQWQQVIPLAVALNVKNIVNTSTYSILSLFLADRWPISKISTIQWLQLLWIDSHFMIGICTCTSCHDTSLSDTTQTLQQSILATASYRQVLHIAMPDFMTGGWGPGRWGWFTSLRLSKLFRSKATYKEWGIELHHGLRM